MTALTYELRGADRLRRLFARTATRMRVEHRARVQEILEFFDVDIERRVAAETTARTGRLEVGYETRIAAVRGDEIEGQVYLPERLFYGHILNVGARAHSGIRRSVEGGRAVSRKRSRGHPALRARRWIERSAEDLAEDAARIHARPVLRLV